MNGKPYQQRGSRPPDRGGYSGGAPSGSPPLFDPQKDASDLVDDLAFREAQNLARINRAQIRQFFQEVKELHRQLGVFDRNERDHAYHKAVEPRFKMLRSRAAYAAGRNKDNEPLKRFIDGAVARVKNAADFEKFVMHFEAVLGFYYYGPERRDSR